MRNVLKPLAKSVLMPLGLTTAASATDAVIRKKVFESGMTILIILNEEMDDILKIINYLEVSSLLIKSVSETIRFEEKEQKSKSLGILLGTLGASLLVNIITGKEDS